MTPHEYCQQKAAASGSSFYYSFLFLDPPRRQMITALYAFCREVDDVVDESHDMATAARTLDWWREEIRALYQGAPTHPVTQALVPAIEARSLPEAHFQEIIDGMAMDLQHARYADFKSLQLYCYRVASVVGLLAAEIFGATDRKTLRYAHDLGIAFQLTNIIRDVREDADRGRIYLPMEDLQRFNVPAADILNARHSDAFAEMIAFQIDRANSYYDQALQALPEADHKTQRTGLIMAAIYRTLLDEIRRDGCRVLTHRTSLTPVRKLWIAGRTWLFG